MEAAAPMLCVNTLARVRGTAHVDMATKETVSSAWAPLVEWVSSGKETTLIIIVMNNQQLISYPLKINIFIAWGRSFFTNRLLIGSGEIL